MSNRKEGKYTETLTMRMKYLEKRLLDEDFSSKEESYIKREIAALQYAIVCISSTPILPQHTYIVPNSIPKNLVEKLKLRFPITIIYQDDVTIQP